MMVKASNRCQTSGPSDVLIGDSAALDGQLKVCGSDLKPENQKKVGKTRHAVAMKQRRNTGTDERKFRRTPANQVEWERYTSTSDKHPIWEGVGHPCSTAS